MGKSRNLQYNEVTRFQNVQHVSALENLRRLYRFFIVDRSPPLNQINVHLEIHRTTNFQEGKRDKHQHEREKVQNLLNGSKQITNMMV